MLAELRQMGPAGRRRVVEAWSHHVPDYVYQPSVDPVHLDSPASYMAPDEIGDRSSLTSDELVATFPSAVKLPHEVKPKVMVLSLGNGGIVLKVIKCQSIVIIFQFPNNA